MECFPTLNRRLNRMHTESVVTAPDVKAVEAALRDLDAAHRCTGSHTFAPDTMRTLEAAARAYLRTPTAPQGAEMAREEAASAFGKMFAGTNPADFPTLPRPPQRYDDAGNEDPKGATILYEDYAELLTVYMRASGRHFSDCAIHNGPAYAPGECNCAALTPTDAETKG